MTITKTLAAAAILSAVPARSALQEAPVKKVIEKISSQVAASERARLETGVRQAALRWTIEDGTPEEFEKFCMENFVVGAKRELILDRFQSKLEALRGHFTAMELELRRELDEDRGELSPMDKMFAAYSPSAHLSADLFKSKLAFTVLLNFPIPSLEESLKLGASWDRRQWAAARLAQMFAFRVPAEVKQKVADAHAAAENYINTYDISMDHVAGPDGKPLFRKDLKLISHWGLRDELKALYADPKGLGRQKTIQAIMERIIRQEIPKAAVAGKDHLWDPIQNTLDGKPAEREPDTRYATLLNVWRAHSLEDPYYPSHPTHMDRLFQLNREIPEPEVEAILISILEAPAGKETASLIQKRLKRELNAFDIWYDAFKPPKGLPQDQLDAMIRKRYPTAESFHKDIPHILAKLGFDPQTAEFLASHIEVNAARGAGHAMGADMRQEKAHLRTRVGKDGMDYQGFNVAMHELGHCVEQVFSLNKMDQYLLKGVPNTAFTEGFAFVFQARDLEILGLKKPDAKAQALKDLDDFWMTREIAGVALVDMRIWHWMYEHPKATPAETRDAMVSIAQGVWNKYYAPLFGGKDCPLLAIYSHIICYALYIPDYPLGHVIAFQVEDFFKTHSLAKEMERLCRIGSVTPAEWMREAINGPISAEPMIKAAQKALTIIR